MHRSRYSSVNIETTLNDGGTGSIRISGKNLFSIASRPVLGAHFDSYSMGTETSGPGEGEEADRSPSFRTEARNEWSYTSTPSIYPLGAILNKAQRQI
jgi:hypothetical protein